MRQLASAYDSKVAVLEITGDFQSAVQVCDKAIRLWGRIVIEKGRLELTHHSAMSFANAASVHINLHDYEQASNFCDSAIYPSIKALMSSRTSPHPIQTRPLSFTVSDSIGKPPNCVTRQLT